MSRHGQSSSKKEAGMICTEILKYLKVNNMLPQPGDLVDPNQLDAYLHSLECGVSAATQEAKLNRIRAGVEFLQVHGKPHGEISRIFTLIQNWSASFSKLARKHNREWLEDTSEDPPGLQTQTDLLKAQHCQVSSTQLSLLQNKGRVCPRAYSNM